MKWVVYETAAFGSEEEAEHQAQLVQLLIWAFPGVVLVLVIRIELNVLADRKQAPGVDCGVAPFAILALVKGLHGAIRRRVIGVNRKTLLDLQTVAIAPREFPALPIEVCPIPVGNKNPAFKGK